MIGDVQPTGPIRGGERVGAPGTRGIFSPELLSRCIACGFCLPACPTYTLTGDEASSPRGRITLMRALEGGDLAADDPTLIEQSSQCLGCRACEPVCPAGVEYGALLEEWRVHQWRSHRSVLLRALLFAVNRTWRVRALGMLRGHARGRHPVDDVPSTTSHLMLGCFERAIFPAVSRAARAVGPNVDVPAAQGCCGALHAHNGDLARGRELARRLGSAMPGGIVTTSGGCAAHLVNELGTERVREFSQWVVDDGALDLNSLVPLAVGGRRARIGLQDSCHLRNGLGVWRQPRAILARLGEYVELPSSGGCCGAAGTYSLLRPRDSRAVLDPKVAEIVAADLDYLAVVNPGCQRQLIQGLRHVRSRTRVVHLAELVERSIDVGRRGDRSPTAAGPVDGESARSKEETCG